MSSTPPAGFAQFREWTEREMRNLREFTERELAEHDEELEALREMVRKIGQRLMRLRKSFSNLRALVLRARQDELD